MAAHRYWRINVASSSFNPGAACLCLSEVQWRTAVGGSDVGHLGTTTASHTSAGSLANLYDGNFSTVWKGMVDSTFPEWIQVDFGGSPQAIAEVTMAAGSDGTDGEQAPTVFAIQWSDDASAWTTVFDASVVNAFGWTLPAASSADAKVFTFSGTNYAFWRLYFTAINNAGASSSTPIRFRQVEWRVTAGGAATAPASFLSSTTHSGMATGFLYSSFGAGEWGTKGPLSSFPLPQWTRATFDPPINIGEVAIAGGPDATQTPKDFLIQKSYDAATWVTAKTLTNETVWAADPADMTVANLYDMVVSGSPYTLNAAPTTVGFTGASAGYQLPSMGWATTSTFPDVTLFNDRNVAYAATVDVVGDDATLRTTRLLGGTPGDFSVGFAAGGGAHRLLWAEPAGLTPATFPAATLYPRHTYRASADAGVYSAVFSAAAGRLSRRLAAESSSVATAWASAVSGGTSGYDFLSIRDTASPIVIR